MKTARTLCLTAHQVLGPRWIAAGQRVEKIVERDFGTVIAGVRKHKTKVSKSWNPCPTSDLDDDDDAFAPDAWDMLRPTSGLKYRRKPVQGATRLETETFLYA